MLVLSEAVRVRAARQGDRAALRALWAEVVDELYTLCCVVLPPEDALDTLGLARRALEARAPALLQHSFREQCLALLYPQLLARLRPGPLAGISAPEVPADGPDPETRVQRTLRRVPAPLRLAWAFATLAGCPAERLAAWGGQPEAELRRARAEVAWLLVAAMKGGA